MSKKLDRKTLKAGRVFHIYLHSQHKPPALNRPLKWSSELTPVPLHWEQLTAPDNWKEKTKNQF